MAAVDAAPAEEWAVTEAARWEAATEAARWVEVIIVPQWAEVTDPQWVVIIGPRWAATITARPDTMAAGVIAPTAEVWVAAVLCA